MGPRARAHLRARGRVQGVWYRASTAREAQALGLDGWVMNLADGSVEALAEGPKAQVEALIAWARVGPPGANVLDLDVQWAPPRNDLDPFHVRR